MQFYFFTERKKNILRDFYFIIIISFPDIFSLLSDMDEAGYREALFIREEPAIELITWFKINIFILNICENQLKYRVKTWYSVLSMKYYATV